MEILNDNIINEMLVSIIRVLIVIGIFAIFTIIMRSLLIK